MIRLRQIALVVEDLDSSVDQISRALDVDVCYRDPGVGVFGLHNALFCIGDQFLELVSPLTDGTTAGRLLDKRGGDGGYMALYEVDDLDARIAYLGKCGVRNVWSGDVPGIRGRHLHPRDTGGTLVSLDEPTIPGEWPWGGSAWKSRRESSVVSSIESFTVSVPDPDACRRRWEDLGIATSVRFSGIGPRGEGLDEVTVECKAPVRDGETLTLGGTTFTLRHLAH